MKNAGRPNKVVRRGGGKTDEVLPRWRRAPVVYASVGNTVPRVAQLVATSEDRVRETIHRCNNPGMNSLDPSVGPWPSRRITTDEMFIFKTANNRPEKLG